MLIFSLFLFKGGESRKLKLPNELSTYTIVKGIGKGTNTKVLLIQIQPIEFNKSNFYFFFTSGLLGHT